jgi:peptidyl-prolyl cis-trans isomerase A (cyclophilin A)
MLKAKTDSLLSLLYRRAGTNQPPAEGGAMLEALEPRAMLAVSILNPVTNQTMVRNGAPLVISLANRYDDPNITGSVARFNTVLGSFNVELFDQAGAGRSRTTPLTVNNFYKYVDSGRWQNTIFHRTSPGFVIQGGGFTRPDFNDVPAASVPTFGNLVNEPGNDNVRGTIAMAKIGGNPDSATSQFFFNLADNRGTPPNGLNFQNGGFTSFGRVLGSGMTVVDALAAVTTYDMRNFYDGQGNQSFAGAANELPLRGTPNNTVTPDNFLTITSVERVGEITYQILSSDSGLVSGAVTGSNLTLSVGANRSGTATITVRAISASGETADNVFNVVVGAVPVLTGFSATPGNVNRPNPISFSVASASVTDGTISRVEYYRDANANNTYDPADTLLGSSTNAANGYAFSIASGTFPGGVNRFFARAIDNLDNASAAQTATVNVVAPRATIASLTVNPAIITRPTSITLTANGVVQGDSPVAAVEFFRDTNRNGTLDDADTKLGEDTNPAGGWTLTFNANSQFPSGQVRLFARAKDATGTTSAPATFVATVNNIAPTLGSLTATPNAVTPGSVIRLDAVNPIDADSFSLKVEFFRDTNNNGAFDAGTDTKIGESLNLDTEGYFLNFNTNGLTNGTYRFFARGVDNDGAFSPVRSVVARIGTPPTITALAAAPTPFTRPNPITLTASGVTGNVARVEFYRDTNANNTFDLGTDTLLGSDTSSLGGWTFSVATNALVGSSFRFFARAIDPDGLASAAVSATATAVNVPPRISYVTGSPNPALRTSTITLSAFGVTDPDGTIARVDFYRDTNRNGLYDPADQLAGTDSSAVGGWTLALPASGLPGGIVRFFAIARDADTGASQPATAQVLITNTAPTIASITLSSPSVLPGGSFTLTANNADDDDDVARVQFFRDSNNNGVFDANTDTLLGEDTDATGGWTLQTSAGNTVGAVRFFARAFDRDGLVSSVVTVSGAVGAAPVITALNPASPNVNRGSNIALTATGITSADGPVDLVEFYRDVNNNNQIDPGTDTLLGSDSTAGDGWSISAPTTGFPGGAVKLLARARNSLGIFSAPVSTTVTIANLAPTLTSLSVNSVSAPRGSQVILTALAPADADGSIARVDFYRDVNNNGAYDPAVDTLLGSDSDPAGGFTFTIPANSLPLGSVRTLARAVDNDGAFSPVRSVLFNVTNAPPVIGSVATTPNPGPRAGTFTINATNVTDLGGPIQSLQFFRDTGNGIFEPAVDTLLGSATLSGNTWSLTINGSTLSFGLNRLFARALDSDGAYSSPFLFFITTT